MAPVRRRWIRPVQGLSGPFLMPTWLNGDQAEGFARSFRPLFRRTSPDAVVDLVRFALQCFSGSRFPLPDGRSRWPKPDAMAEAMVAVCGDPVPALDATRSCLALLEAPEFSEASPYLEAIAAACAAHPQADVPSSDAWRRIVFEQLQEMAAAHGFGSHLLQRFEPALGPLREVLSSEMGSIYGRGLLAAWLMSFSPPERVGAMLATLIPPSSLAGIHRISRTLDHLARAGSLEPGPATVRQKATIPAHPWIDAALHALYHGGPRARALFGGWRPQWPLPLAYAHGPGGHVRVTLAPATGPVHMDACWADVETLGPLTIDVLLIALAHLLDGAQSAHTLPAAALSLDQLLEEMGIQRRGEPRQSMLCRLADELGRIGRLRILCGVDGTPEPLIHVLPLVEPTTARQAPPVWLIAPGNWAGSPALSVIEVPMEIVRLDHRGNRGAAALATKLGLHLLWHRGRLDAPVADLLRELGEWVVAEERKKDHAGRLRDRVEEAALRLEDLRLCEVLWPEGLGPGDLDRHKGWFSRWQTARMRLLATRAATRGAGNPSGQVEPEDLLGPRLRAARVARGWTQARLARRLGVSPTTLSHLENGGRPAPDVLRRIREWTRDE